MGKIRWGEQGEESNLPPAHIINVATHEGGKTSGRTSTTSGPFSRTGSGAPPGLPLFESAWLMCHYVVGFRARGLIMKMTEDEESLHQRLLTGKNLEALDSLAQVITSWMVPFIKKWRMTGNQPVPSPENIANIKNKIDELIAGQVFLPSGYEWLPDFLMRLSSSMRLNRRNFVNIHPNPYIPSIVAGVTVALQNPNNIVAAVSEATTKLEEECVSWMAKNIIGFDPFRATGNIVSGGTLANLTALLVARDYCYRKLSRPRPADVRGRGLWNQPGGVILATAGSHYSIKKAAWILGLGDENVVRIPVAFDEEGYLRKTRDKQFISGIRNSYWSDLIHNSSIQDEQKGEQELQDFYKGNDGAFGLQPLNSEVFKALYGCFVYHTPLIAYVFTVGTTDTGTIENPDHDALKLLGEEDVYVHADAAVGGFALLHENVRNKTQGLNNVHSVTIDAHKLGHLAYANGAILFRDKSWALEIMHDAPYLRGLAPTIEGSRPGTYVASLWAAIQDLGIKGLYVRWLERLFRFINELAAALRASDKYQILHSINLTTVDIAPLPEKGETRQQLNELVREVHESVEKDTEARAFLINIDRELAGIKVRNSNQFRGAEPVEEGDRMMDIQCLRIVVTNPEVHPSDAPRLVEYLEEKLSRARRGKCYGNLRRDSS